MAWLCDCREPIYAELDGLLSAILAFTVRIAEYGERYGTANL